VFHRFLDAGDDLVPGVDLVEAALHGALTDEQTRAKVSPGSHAQATLGAHRSGEGIPPFQLWESREVGIS
jgi:hypothetical protein